MDFTKYLVYCLVAAAGFTAGQMHQKGKQQEPVHYCATVAGSNAELILDSSITLHMEDGQILAVLGTDQLEAVLKDERLSFHACK